MKHSKILSLSALSLVLIVLNGCAASRYGSNSFLPSTSKAPSLPPLLTDQLEESANEGKCGDQPNSTAICVYGIVAQLSPFQWQLPIGDSQVATIEWRKLHSRIQQDKIPPAEDKEHKDRQLVFSFVGPNADYAGLKVGDRLVEINGEPVTNMTRYQAIMLFRGTASDGNQPLKLKVERTEAGRTTVVSITVGRTFYWLSFERNKGWREGLCPNASGDMSSAKWTIAPQNFLFVPVGECHI